MKAFLAVSIAFLFCLPGLALHRNVENKISAYELVKAFSAEHAEKLPESIRSVQLKKFSAKKNRISFYFKGAYIRIEAVGKRNKVLLLNGRAFSAKDLKSEKSIRLAVVSKFGLVVKVTANHLLELVRSRAFASTSPVSPLEASDSTDSDPFYGTIPVDNPMAQNTSGANGTEMSGQKYDVYDVGESPNLGTSYTAKKLQGPFDLMTGENQGAMLKFLDVWLGGFNHYLGGGNSALGIAAGALGVSGLGAGTQFAQFLQLGVSPSSILAPHQK